MGWRFSLFLVLVSSLSYVTLAQQQQQPVPTPANIVCYQEVVASQGTYAQIDSSLTAWAQKMYQTLGLTGPQQLSVGWARVPDRTGFENGCTGPYPNIADLFVHIQTTGGSNFDSISSSLESFISANRLTSQPNIVCSARSIVTFLPGCGKTGAAPINNATLVPPTNATGNETTSAPTGPSNNATVTGPPTTTPTTSAPSNATSNVTTEAPTTSAPTFNATAVPTGANATQAPTTEAPTTEAPTTVASTQAPTTEAPTSQAPTTQAPTTQAPTTEAPTSEAPTQAPTTQAPTQGSTQGPTHAPTTHNVTVNNNFYSPASVTINQGDTVTWIWNGGPHTVTSGTPTSGPDGKFCSLPSGQTSSVQACSGTSYAQNSPATYSHTFDIEGTFPYYCTVHGSLMTGSIIVNPNVVGGASLDQSTTGTVSANGAQPVIVTSIWMSIAIILSSMVIVL